MRGLLAAARFLMRNTKRMAILAVGTGVVAAGAAMLVLPGPGWLVIIAGLAILATEFAWADRVLRRTRERARLLAQSGAKSIRRARKDPQPIAMEPEDGRADDQSSSRSADTKAS